jgi:chemotaxis protein methyltransferase CheR
MPQTVDYRGYKARTPSRGRITFRAFLRQLYAFARTRILYEVLLYPYGLWRHRAILKSAHRTQSHTYTCFYRSPTQLEALTGPVLEFIRGIRGSEQRVEILIFACSNGAEAYTIASVLRSRYPQLDFHIVASDLHREMVDKTVKGRYSHDEVYHSPHVDDAFVAATFDRSGEWYLIKDEIRGRISFCTASLLDPALESRFRPADIVLAQNVLFHLDPPSATAAFVNLLRCAKPRSALFVEGIDLGLKETLTRRYGLRPLPFRHRDIYQEARMHVSPAWWRFYYGREPYTIWRRDRIRRYGSIFLRDGATSVRDDAHL